MWRRFHEYWLNQSEKVPVLVVRYEVSLSQTLKVYFSIPLTSYFTWSAALGSSGVLPPYSTASLA